MGLKRLKHQEAKIIGNHLSNCLPQMIKHFWPSDEWNKGIQIWYHSTKHKRHYISFVVKKDISFGFTLECMSQTDIIIGTSLRWQYHNYLFVMHFSLFVDVPCWSQSESIIVIGNVMLQFTSLREVPCLLFSLSLCMITNSHKKKKRHSEFVKFASGHHVRASNQI